MPVDHTQYNPPTHLYPYNIMTEAETRELIERSAADKAAQDEAKRVRAQQDRALKDAVLAQKGALSSVMTPGGSSSTAQNRQENAPAAQQAGPSAPSASNTLTHSISPSIPHHHHHHHHHHHPAPLQADRPGYSASNPGPSTGSGTSQRPNTGSTPNSGGSNPPRPYSYGSQQGTPAAGPYSRQPTPQDQTRVMSPTAPTGRAPTPSATSARQGPASISPQAAPAVPPMFGGTRTLPSPFEGEQPRRHLDRPEAPPAPRSPQNANDSRDPARSPTSRAPSAQIPQSAPVTGASERRYPTDTRQSPAYPPFYQPSAYSTTQPSTTPTVSPPNTHGSAPQNPSSTANAASIAAYNRDRDREAQERREREQRQREAQNRRDREQVEADIARAESRRLQQEADDRQRAAAAKTAIPANRYPQEPGSLISQVAPVREPRPYTLKAETLPNNPPLSAQNGGSQSSAALAAQREREYQYNPRERDPRENRSRMDLAVEEQNKRSATAAISAVSRKRKKEESVLSASNGGKATPRTVPVPAVRPPRDGGWPSLTEVGRKKSEVDGRVMRRWLGDNPNGRVFNYEYDGRTIADLGLGQEWAGGQVIVRIPPAYLGRAWWLMSALHQSWEPSEPHSHEGAMGLDMEIEGGDRGGYDDVAWCKCWGTDYYTDDSGLGSVLVHCGQLRWKRGEQEGLPMIGKDGLKVVIRLLPQMTRYVGNIKHGIRSRAWGNGHDGLTIQVLEAKRILNYHDVPPGEPSRKRQKSRVRDFNAQRVALQTEGKSRHGEEAIVWFPSGSAGDQKIGAMIKYSPGAVSSWLSVSDPASLWRRNLELKSGDDTYSFTLDQQISTHSLPVLTLQLSSPRLDLPASSVWDRLGVTATADKFTWTDAGLIVRPSEKMGALIPIEGYRWIDNGDVFLADSSSSASGSEGRRDGDMVKAEPKREEEDGMEGAEQEMANGEEAVEEDSRMEESGETGAE